MNLKQQVPIIGAKDGSQLIDMSVYESKVRKDVANLAQGILQTHACTAECALRIAQDFYRLKELYLRTGEIGASEGAVEPTDA